MFQTSIFQSWGCLREMPTILRRVPIWYFYIYIRFASWMLSFILFPYCFDLLTCRKLSALLISNPIEMNSHIPVIFTSWGGSLLSGEILSEWSSLRVPVKVFSTSQRLRSWSTWRRNYLNLQLATPNPSSLPASDMGTPTASMIIGAREEFRMPSVKTRAYIDGISLDWTCLMSRYCVHCSNCPACG